MIKHTICDIIASIPWQGDSGEWAKANYWIDGRRYTVDSCSSGDHEFISKKDIPSDKEITEKWLEYSRWVLEHGEDPLHKFFIKTTLKKKERWQFRFSPIIGGVAVIAARHAGKDFLRTELPPHVVEFLNLGKDCRRLQDFANAGELKAAGIPLHRWYTETLTVDVPNRRYVRELKTLARRHLKRLA